jgi:hypothetical protein
VARDDGSSSPTRTRVVAAREAVAMMRVKMVGEDERHGAQHKRGLGLAKVRALW